MKASLFATAEDNRPVEWSEEGGWESFSGALLEDPQPHPDPFGTMTEKAWKAAKTHLRAWSPATFRSGGKRCSADVTYVHAFVVDLDDVPTVTLGAVLTRFEEYEYLCHTSPGIVRCRPSETRVRVILPLASPVSGKDWPRVWSSLADRFGLSDLDCFDKTCKGSAWIYFAPCEGVQAFRNRGIYLEATARESITPRDLKAIGQALSKRKDPEAQRIGRALRAAAAGEMYADHPHRDQTMREITWWLARERPLADPGSVVRALIPSMTAPGHLPDDPDEARVLALFIGALEKIDQPIAALLDTKRMVEAWAPIERATPYTDEELAALDVDEHEWILMHQKAIYLRGPHGYRGPFGITDGGVAALTHLSPAPIILHATSQNGNTRVRTIVELCEDYGRAITTSCVDLTAQKPRYDRSEDCYYEAPCPLRHYEPEFHPEIAEWLEIMAGTRESLVAIMTWLHYLTQLDKPCAALYLTGAPDTGKSLLASELAKLWTSKGPTELGVALDDKYNEGLLGCPLVFGDEFVPKGKADEIKRFIAERDRPIKRKYIPVGRMLGCARLIVAANNLRFADTYGDMTEEDIQAHLDRFCGIDVRPETREWLQRQNIQKWVDTNAIPKFAMWARHEYRAQPSGRFLVRGPRHGKLQVALATRTGVRALLCEWLHRFVMSPKSGLAGARGNLMIDGQGARSRGRILAKPAGVRDCWEIYNTRDPVPRLGQINHAIGALASQHRVMIGSTKMIEIDLDTLGAWCEDTGACTKEELQEELDKVANGLHSARTGGKSTAAELSN
jgi:hypothetical protein